MTHFINSLIMHCSAKRLFALVLFSGAVLFLAFTQSAVGQGVIVHSQFSSDDGDPTKDADGVTGKNGIVVWKGGGSVHVVSGRYFVEKSQTLEIKPGAVVKIANQFLVSTSGTVSWIPGGWIDLYDGATFLVDGAIITDIRDDAESGDTNQDGNSSAPPDFKSASASDFYTMGFHWNGGMVKGYIKNSTLKYATLNGSMLVITDNKFLVFNQWKFPLAFYVPDPALVPVVSRNIFEFATNGSSIEFRGANPIIEENTFRYITGAKTRSGWPSAIIFIGPTVQGSANVLTPASGTTIIANNLFETGGGIWLSPTSVPTQDEDATLARFRAEIRNNTFRGVGLPGEGVIYGNLCLRLDLRANVAVTYNKFSNYLYFSGIQVRKRLNIQWLAYEL